MFKIYAYEEVEKKGKLPRESLGATKDTVGTTKNPFSNSIPSK
jgi:hypothetical protein